MIYKPTSCEPLLLTFDAKQTPFFLECQVDSANTNVDAYSIKLLDSENGIVFDNINDAITMGALTLLSDLETYFNTNYADYGVGYTNLNKGYNGSYIKIPLMVDKNFASTNTVKQNQIYYDKDSDKFYKSSNNTEVNIYNGQSYKWQITLYQLQTDKNTGVKILPLLTKFFDMSITNGTIMGSNDERIQSVVSDNIYSDYYIQPVQINGLDIINEKQWTFSELQGGIQNVGSRVLIKSYDLTYGYIYPVTGDNGFTTDTTKKLTINPDNAQGFKIYKRGNNNDNLTAYQQVSLVTDHPLDRQTEKSSKWEWKPVYTSAGDSYAIMTYIESTDPSGSYSVPGINTALVGSERIVLNGQLDKAQYGDSAYWKNVDAPTGYIESKEYDQYAIVLYDAKYYVSLESNNSGHIPSAAESASWWRQVGDSIPEFSDSGTPVSYSEYAAVTYNTYYYVAIQTVTDPTSDNQKPNKGEYLGSPYNGVYYPSFVTEAIDPVEYWKEVVSVEWLNTSEYSEYDVVMYNSNYYVSKIDNNINNQPDVMSNAWEYQDSPNEIYDNETQYSKYDTVLWSSGSLILDRYVYINNQSRSGVKPDGSKCYKITTTWRRTPDADTWGELLSKILFVNNNDNGGYWKENIQIEEKLDSSSAYGIINETPFKFVAEKPIELYNITGDPLKNNKQINTVGLIFYNNICTNSEDGKLYIRPFTGLQNGMRLLRTTTNNYQEYFDIKTLNTEYWYVKYSQLYQHNTYQPDIEGVQISDNNDYWRIDQTQYQIKTYFRDSDENTFYFNTTPTIHLHFYSSEDTDIENDYIESVIKENYDPAKTYQVGDVVFDNNNGNDLYYYCKIDDTLNIDPSENVKVYVNVNTTGLNEICNPSYEVENKTRNWSKSSVNLSQWVENVGYQLYDAVWIGEDPNKKYYINISGNNTTTPPDEDSTNWLLSTYYGEFNEYRTYHLYDIVIYDSKTYVKISNQYLTIPPINSSAWNNSVNQWNSGTKYYKNDIVLHNGLYWKARKDNQNKEPGSQSVIDWRQLSVETWQVGTIYPANSIVRYGNNWEVYEQGVYTGEYESSKDYFIGEVVWHENDYYLCDVKSGNFNILWYTISESVSDIGIYNNSTKYNQYDVVKYNGIYYISRQNNNINHPVSDDTWWKNYGANIPQYNQATSYNEYDLVTLNSIVYVRNNKSKNETPIRNSITKYDIGHVYKVGDIVHYTTSGNTYYYVCIRNPEIAIPPTNTKYWRKYQWQNYTVDISSRMLVCKADYQQLEYIQWKSSQWFLYNTNGDLIDKSDIIYDNLITYIFTGLDGNSSYVIELVVETYQGFRVVVDQEIKTSFTIEEIDGTGLISTDFDCDKMAITSTITTASGFIRPVLLNANGVADYKYVQEGNDLIGQMQLLNNGSMEYNQIISQLDNVSNNATNPVRIKTESDQLEIKADFQINSNNFTGNLFTLESYAAQTSSSTPNTSYFTMYMPDQLVTASGADYGLGNLISLSNNYNILYTDLNHDITDPGIVRLFDGKNLSAPVTNNEWIESSVVKTKGSYTTVSNWQPANIDVVLHINDTNYLPISYANVQNEPETDYLNINNYFNVYSNTYTDISPSSPCTTLSILNIQQSYINKDNFNTDLICVENNMQATVFNVTDNCSGRMGDSIYIFGSTPQLWSDLHCVAKPVVLSAESEYIQKNVYQKFNNVWNDDAACQNNGRWYDGTPIQRIGNDELQLGSVIINNEIYHTEWLHSESNKTIYNSSLLKLQNEVFDGDSYINPERAKLNGHHFCIDVPLYANIEESYIYSPDPEETGEDYSPVIYIV